MASLARCRSFLLTSLVTLSFAGVVNPGRQIFLLEPLARLANALLGVLAWATTNGSIFITIAVIAMSAALGQHLHSRLFLLLLPLASVSTLAGDVIDGRSGVVVVAAAVPEDGAVPGGVVVDVALRLVVGGGVQDLGVDLQLLLVEGEAAAVAEAQLGAVGHAGGAVSAALYVSV